MATGDGCGQSVKILLDTADICADVLRALPGWSVPLYPKVDGRDSGDIPLMECKIPYSMRQWTGENPPNFEKYLDKS